MDYPQPIGPLSHNTSLQFVLDSKSMTTDIEWTFNTETSHFDYLKADYDIIQVIQQKNTELLMQSTISWVKGHQDRDKMWGDLTPAAKANVYADETCDETHTRPVAKCAVFPTLLHKGKPVTKKIEHYTSVAATTI